MKTQRNTLKQSKGERHKTAQVVVHTQRKGVAAKLHAPVIAHPEDRIKLILIGHRKKAGTAVSWIRDGLPLSSIQRLQQSLRIEQEATILKLLGISVRTYQRRKRDNKPLDPIESDRLYRLAKIAARAAEVLPDENLAIDWLKSPNRALGAKPLELLDTEAGADMVERVLTRIEYGVYS
ncbi:MAG: antitoxin Xre/MbcA/ParS toxin-binding domain-containing protein [Pseudomonadota bacterium]